MNDKIFPKKAHRHHTLWYWMAFSFAVCIGVLLGVNIALLIFASTSVVLLTLLAGLTSGQVLAYIISLLIAALLGVAFLAGYIWTFAGASSTYEAAKAYTEEYGLNWPWPQYLVIGLELFFIVLDLISLWYRKQFFAARGAEQLFWFFVVLSLLSPVVGLLMHILENKPLRYRLTEAQRRASNLVGDDLEQLIDTMPFERRARIISGDETALSEHLEYIRQREQEVEQIEQARVKERDERRRNSNRPLVSASLLQSQNQAKRGSSQNDNQ